MISGEGMTKEEAIKLFNTVLLFGECDCSKEEIEECLKMAIKALERQPCEDAISRADIKKYLSAPNENGERVIYESDLDLLPPISPQSKWTLCSERLPTKEECIANNGLFIVSDGDRTYAEYFGIYSSMKYFGEPTMSGFRVDRCVIAWMPLPKPYDSQESEEV